MHDSSPLIGSTKGLANFAWGRIFELLSKRDRCALRIAIKGLDVIGKWVTSDEKNQYIKKQPVRWFRSLRPVKQNISENLLCVVENRLGGKSASLHIKKRRICLAIGTEEIERDLPTALERVINGPRVVRLQDVYPAIKCETPGGTTKILADDETRHRVFREGVPRKLNFGKKAQKVQVPSEIPNLAWDYWDAD